MVEHDMQVAISSECIIDIGQGAGDEGGKIVAQGSPEQVAQSEINRTAPIMGS
ncbi:hypothetical protein PSYCG_09630 [Psychrobacter sp. G]|nr:hypothetical protein PSYCG_09630 [Psychrobacter sp. G]